MWLARSPVTEAALRSMKSPAFGMLKLIDRHREIGQADVAQTAAATDADAGVVRALPSPRRPSPALR